MRIVTYPVQLDATKRAARARAALLDLSAPSTEALELASSLAARVHRSAQVRRVFVGRADGQSDGPAPPLAEILRSGRGGAVRLKLYLSLLWIAARPPHSVQGTASAWATLLSLDEPSRKGARQIRSAIAWLGAHGLLTEERQQGVGINVTLLSDSGSGEPYRVPGLALKQARERGGEPDPDDFYDSLPPTFWTKGWIHVLSAPAIAMLLVLLDIRRGQIDRELWISEKQAESRYTLSEETRARGLAELEVFGVVMSSERSFRSNSMELLRQRRVYVLHLDTLSQSPPGVE